jgi:hydrogenase nickel incorporation protein HypA/HybF
VHELGLVESLVQTVEDALGDERVLAVWLEVGALVAVVPDALRFCFDVCAQGTRLEGARLDIAEVPGRGRCRSCGVTLELAAGPPVCACGSVDVEITAGLELRIREVEVAAARR